MWFAMLWSRVMGEEGRADDEEDVVRRSDLDAIFNAWLLGTSSGLVPSIPAQ